MGDTYQGTAVFGDFLASVGGTFNSATTNNTSSNLAVQGYGIVQASAVVTLPITAGSLNFEVSDDGGTTWWPINGVQTGSFTTQSIFNLNGATSASWDFSVGAYTNFRIRLNPVILGVGTVVIRIQAESLPRDVTTVVGQGTSPWVTNVTQFSGTAADTNSGLKSAGTLRVVLATDQPALTNKLLVTPDSVALPANQSVNAAQFAGTNASTGVGASGAGIPRVTVANDSNILATQSGTWNIGTTTTLTGITNTVVTSSVPVTTGGCTTAVSQALTTSINVKASAGQLYGYTISNPNAVVAYVEYYNTATTPGTIGATTALILEIMIPAGSSANVSFDEGIAFALGIAVAVATTATGAVAPTTGLTITTIFK
jgi:hypothetical protein